MLERETSSRNYCLLATSKERTNGTLIPLNKSYIVPGGRFREIYYWDSYFTMLGLIVDDKLDLAQNMIDNFADLIEHVGFIPNGNRKYYLSRSQPPYFSFMIEALANAVKDDFLYIKYLPSLEKEYNFWMNGSTEVSAKHRASKHVVMMKDGELLNRYYDELNIPRFEMYRKDKETAKKLSQQDLSLQSSIVYRYVYKSQQYKKYLEVANTIRLRWMGLCENVYNNTYKLLEKYHVVELTDTGGGEYPNQDGFG